MASLVGIRQSERRHATVLFADISGFTALSEQLDPEVVTSVMNRCYEMLERIVLTHGGTVAQYQGDCVVALFGVPTAIEDTPRQAVNAAIEIRNRLRELDEPHQPLVHLDVHMGLNSGLVIAGEVGGHVKRDFTVMGDAVNVAARLKDVSPPGQIYVGHETYQATKGEFEYRPLKPLMLKGKKESIPAYELLSRHERIHRPKIGAASRMISSAMIGREPERALIEHTVAQLLEGRGRIVNIIGEAGIGKSRLLAEVEALPAVQRTTLLVGRSLAIGQNLSFHPFVDLLKQWAGIGDEDGEPQQVAKLERAVASVDAPISDVVPFVATLMGIRLSGEHGERVRGIDGEALEKLILKSMRELVEKIAAAKPLILVFEDLYWADQSSITLLEGLLRLTAEAPVLVMAIARPDFPQTSGRIARVAREEFAERYLELQLGPLDDQQCDDLVRNLLQIEDLPRTARTLIANTAEGNPFFVEEIVRSLIDEGAVELRDGRLHVTEKVQAVVIPATIQEVIMARLDRLHESARSLLQVASVIGRYFSHRVIGDVMAPAVALEDDLAYLRERQLIIERPVKPLRHATAAPEREYLFTHALVQDTIYESILQKTRKDLHLRVARAIESLYRDRLPDFYGMLAYHYSRAESLEKAEEYLFKAGDEAARAAASREALTYFREASRLYLLIHGQGGDPHKKALLEKNIGLALLNKGDLTDSIEHFDQALQFLGERIPRTRLAMARRFVVDLAVLLARLYLNRLAGALRRTDRETFEIRYSRARAQTTSDPKRFMFDTIDGLRQLARSDPTAIDQACGMYTAAAAVFAWSGLSLAIGKRFLTVAQSLIKPGNTRDEAAYRLWKFVLHYFEGDWSDAQAVPDELVEHALRYGQFWDVNTYLGLNCERRMLQGDFAAAQQEIDRITELAEVYGYDFARSNQYAMPAFLQLTQRRLADALGAVERYYADRDEDLLRLNALGTKAKIQVLMGDGGAADTLARADELRRRLGQVPGYHRSMLVTGRLLFDLRALEECPHGGGARRMLAWRARRSARQAIRLAATVARERVEVYRLAGRLWWRLGKSERAVGWWERSLREGERMAARPELARTYLEVGQRLTEAGSGARLVNGKPAATYIDAARRLFVEMNLTWDLERAGETGQRRVAA